MAWKKKTKIVIYVVAAIAASVGLGVGIFYAVKKLGPKSTTPPKPEPKPKPEPEPEPPSGEYFCVAVDDATPLPPCTRSDGSVVPVTECTCRFQCRD
jgi:flagellar basal body-associated protein FliL